MTRTYGVSDEGSKQRENKTDLFVLRDDVVEQARVNLRIVAALLHGHSVHLAGLDFAGFVCGINLGNRNKRRKRVLLR